MVKHLPTMRETPVQSLGWEDPLEKDTTTHSSTIAWKIPWTEEPGRLQFMGSQSWSRLSDFTSLTYMEFRKMVIITLYVRQQKRHRYKEQIFGLWERERVG